MADEPKYVTYLKAVLEDKFSPAYAALLAEAAKGNKQLIQVLKLAQEQMKLEGKAQQASGKAAADSSQKKVAVKKAEVQEVGKLNKQELAEFNRLLKEEEKAQKDSLKRRESIQKAWDDRRVQMALAAAKAADKAAAGTVVANKTSYSSKAMEHAIALEKRYADALRSRQAAIRQKYRDPGAVQALTAQHGALGSRLSSQDALEEAKLAKTERYLRRKYAITQAYENRLLALQKMVNNKEIGEEEASERRKAAVVQKSSLLATLRNQGKQRVAIAKLTADEELMVVRRTLREYARLRAKQARDTAKLTMEGNKANRSRQERFGHFGSFTSMMMGGQGYMAYNLMKMGPQLALIAGGVLGVVKAFQVLGSQITTASKTARDFEKAMSDIRSVAMIRRDDLGKPIKSLDQAMNELTMSTKLLGRTTVFTAKEVADAYYELAKLGMNTDQLIQAGPGIVNLAAATGTSIQDAGTVAMKVMQQYGMGAQEMTNIVDTMTMAFNASALDLTKFANTMEYAGPVASAVGISMEETTAAMAVMADKGIDAEKAGTALRSMFIELGDKGSKAMKLLAKQGITTTDTLQTKLRGLQKLQLSPGGLKTLFTKWASTGATALLTSLSEFETYLSEIGAKAEGEAARQARIRLDNLAGDMTYLKSVTETAYIELGETINTALRGIIQDVTVRFADLANWMRDHKTALTNVFTSMATEIRTVIRELGNLFDKVKNVADFFGLSLGTDKYDVELPSITNYDALMKWDRETKKKLEESQKDYADAAKDQTRALNRLLVNDADGVVRRFKSEFKTAKSYDDLKNKILGKATEAGYNSADLGVLEEQLEKYATSSKLSSLLPMVSPVATVAAGWNKVRKAVTNSDVEAYAKDLYKANDILDKAGNYASTVAEKRATSAAENLKELEMTERSMQLELQAYQKERDRIRQMVELGTATAKDREDLLVAEKRYADLSKKIAEQQDIKAYYGNQVGMVFEDFSVKPLGTNELKNKKRGGGGKYKFRPKTEDFFFNIWQDYYQKSASKKLALDAIKLDNEKATEVFNALREAENTKTQFTETYNKEAQRFKQFLANAFENSGREGAEGDAFAAIGEEIMGISDRLLTDVEMWGTTEAILQDYADTAIRNGLMTQSSWDTFWQNRIKAMTEAKNYSAFAEEEARLTLENIKKTARLEYEASEMAGRHAIRGNSFLAPLLSPGDRREAVNKERSTQKEQDVKNALVAYGDVSARKDDKGNLVKDQYGQIIYDYKETEESRKKVYEINADYAELEQQQYWIMQSERIEGVKGYADMVVETYGYVNETMQIYHDMEIARIESRYEKERASIERLNNQHMISSRTAAVLQQRAEEKKQRALAASAKKMKMWAKVAATLEYLSGLVGIAAYWAKYGPGGAIGAAIQGAAFTGLFAAKMAQIDEQKFATGGFPSGANALVRMNERGQEAVLNASATARLGRRNINDLNAGRTPTLQRNETKQVFVYSPSHRFETPSSKVDIVEALKRDREGFAEFVHDSRRRGYKL